MVILVVKSRCYKVGMDIGAQFEPTYMRLLATRIASSIDQNVPYAHDYYVKKERLIKIDGAIELKVVLTPEAFTAIEQKRPITADASQDWIRLNVVGRVTKSDLDDERARETDALDMMQNSSIVYHTESITEMQLIAQILVWMFN